MKILAAALAAALCATSAVAQPDFPSKRITLVVAAATGGGLDAVARLIGKRMQDAWGQAVVVEDQGGAEGLIATKRVAESPADGYTMLVQIPSLLLLKHTAKDLDFDPALAFTPVTEIGRTPSVISVQTSLGVKTIKDLVAYCNKAAAPCTWGYGQQLSYLYGKRAFALSGIKSTIGVPYKGTGPVINDLLGGHITIGMTSIAAPLPHHQAGTLRILAVNAEKRLSQAPDVPTFREAGLNVPPRGSWYGLFVPKGTPADVVAKIEKALMPLAHDPAAAAVVRGLGAEPVFGSSKEFAAGVAEENAFLSELVKEYPLVDHR
jgi:tripartite-type tricarboxylate transporter receptor subunit TctC